ncbi:putative NADH dehydrogenase [Lachnellula occidentalis]|uniref:Putative NADH dehydrogenase n=1 Tax=Lachnellula occidentalis TaxID=215460 RepID=A0A8H8UHL2_9HELO|nr:putative NADH dehydrogenase [Lachnellula occidentalis]
MNSMLNTSRSCSRAFRANPALSRLLCRARERVVILGSGWSGFVLSRELDKKKFQTVVVSPRTYFAFTPLLASTAVGTLEFRTTVESVRQRQSKVEFFQGWADDVNFHEKKLCIEEAVRNVVPPKSGEMNSVTDRDASSTSTKPSGKGKTFDLSYDKLVVAVGCYSQTFNTPGVRENAFFLRDVVDAQRIRKRVLEIFEIASLPTTSEQLKDQLLNFAVVGGGPTGVEFAAELYDLCHEDLIKVYPRLIPRIKISIYDVAQKILPMFDAKLANYATQKFKRDGIAIRTEHHIEELRSGLPGSSGEAGGCFTLKTKEKGEVGIGMCVWSTGLMMNPFIQKAMDDVHTYPTSSATQSTELPTDPSSINWHLKRSPKTGGLVVDDKFRVKLTPRDDSVGESAAAEATVNDVFALGDVSVMEKTPLPATAQVANQEAKWLGKRLNKGDIEQNNFTFKNMGVMTYVGDMKAIMQGGQGQEIRGWIAWVIWRGAYLTKTLSWRNKLLVPIYVSHPFLGNFSPPSTGDHANMMFRVINYAFGRDISRF